MTRTEIRKDLETHIGSPFACKAEIAEALKIGKNKVNEICYGLHFFRAGRKHLYYLGDVADRIVDGKEVEF